MLAFLDDSTRLASASRDTTLEIWDVSSDTCLRTSDIGGVVSNTSFDTTGSYLHTEYRHCYYRCSISLKYNTECNGSSKASISRWGFVIRGKTDNVTGNTVARKILKLFFAHRARLDAAARFLANWSIVTNGTFSTLPLISDDLCRCALAYLVQTRHFWSSVLPVPTPTESAQFIRFI